MYRYFFSLIFLSYFCGILHSQSDSPVGKWVLKEHLIQVLQGDTTYIDSNVFHQQFSSTLTFDSSGTFIHEIYNRQFHGTWRLRKDRKKFSMKYNDGRKMVKKTVRWDEFNFELPLRIGEQFTDLYPAPSFDYFQGQSVYIRADPGTPAEISTTLIGKWQMCTHWEQNPDESCNTDFYSEYTFNADGTYTETQEYKEKTYSLSGSWKMINKNLLIIDGGDDSSTFVYPMQYDITWVNDSLFFDESRESRWENRGPIVYTYFKKI